MCCRTYEEVVQQAGGCYPLCHAVALVDEGAVQASARMRIGSLCGVMSLRHRSTLRSSTERLRRTSTTACLGALVLLAATGCGGSGGPKATPPPATSPASASSSPPASSAAPTAEQLNGVLLAAAEVGATAHGSFTAGPASASESSSSGCPALEAFGKAAKASEKAKGGSGFADQSGQQAAEEDLVYVPGAAALFATLKSAVGSCKNLSTGGDTLALSALPAPSVPGSDDTIAVQGTGQISGQTATADVFEARFGDTVVQIFYGGGVTPDKAASVASQLLQQAAAKAQPVLRPHG